MTEAQKCLYHIAENMRMDKSISKEGYEYFQQAIQALEQEPCTDVISRQAAIDCLNADFTIDGKENMETVVDYINGAFKQIKALPSVTPNTQWHKVGEGEIPNDKVLCVSKYNEYVVGYMFESEVCVTGYAVESENELMYDVAVWMPLPKLEE